MNSVLFVCTGNMYRSPIAAEIFRNLLIRDGWDGQWNVSSAGTWTVEDQPPPGRAARIAKSLGLQIENHRTRMLNLQIMEESDLILVMEGGHLEALRTEFPFAQHKVRLLAQVLHGLQYDIPDPAASPNEAYNIIQEMADLIQRGYRNIYKAAGV